MRYLGFPLFGRRVSLWLGPSLSLAWGREHEYWTTYKLGPLAVLVSHSKAYWDAEEQSIRDICGDDECDTPS